MEQRNIDSISNSSTCEDKHESYIIDIEIPREYQYIDSVKINEVIKNKKAIWNPPNNKYALLVPGAKIHIEKSSSQSKVDENKTNVSKKAELIKEKVEKKKVSQSVILAIVIAFFICLIVRYAKKVREKFGR